MNDKKKALAFSALIPFLILGLQSAYAEPFITNEVGQDYTKTLLEVNPDGTRTYEWTSSPDRIITWYNNGQPVYSDYRLNEDVNSITVETMNAGSISWNKNSCSYDIYPNGYIDGQTPKVKNISWTVKGKLSSSSTWSSVNSVNNAACNTTLQHDGTNLTITGQKTNTIGTFQIVIEYSPGMGFKETMRAYNNNPTWNNHHIGFTETFEVPQIIKFGALEYDLANYNGTTLNRAWIENNQAKLINLFDDYVYDFGIGYDNLENVKITYQSGIAKLSLNYLYTNSIVPYQQWVEVDPTFGPASSGALQHLYKTGAAGTGCPTTTAGKDTTTPRAEKNSNGGSTAGTGGDGCHRIAFQWDTTTINDNIGIISVMNFTTTYSGLANMATESCEMRRIYDDPATASGELLWRQGNASTTLVTGNTQCRTASSQTIQLGTTAQNNLISAVRAGNNTFGALFKLTSETRDGSGHSVQISVPTLKVVYETAQIPYAVTDLSAVGLTSNAITISWTTPNLRNSTLQSWQINYTTPHGNPNSILINSASPSTMSYTVGDLAENTDYSFRVGIRSNLGNNMSGNIANATSGVRAGNFTIGYFNFNATNPLFDGIQFQRTDTNNTHTTVRVIYDEDYTLRCTVASTFARTSNTYNITGSVYDTNRESSLFTFINHENDVINIDCWDTITNDTGTYYLNQESGWVLLNMIQNFRNGTYGTEGKFGAFDFVTFIVLILGMIGLNRVNDALGGIFMVVSIGALAVLGIITWEAGVIFGMIAFAVMIAIVTTRKD